MAVRHKTGLDYFPLDVDFFDDEKVEFAAARFGTKGEIIAIKLLCKIYRNGYYTEWNEDESMLFAKRAGDSITPSLVNEVVQELVKRGFFSEFLVNRFKILTSSGIQKRYFEAVERRKEVAAIQDFLLIDVSELHNVNISVQNVNISPPDADISKQSKVEESKVKESRKKSASAFSPPSIGEVISFFSENFYSEEHARKAYRHYELGNWHDANGKQVKNWKQKMHNSWFKDEGRINAKSTLNGTSVGDLFKQALNSEGR